MAQEPKRKRLLIAAESFADARPAIRIAGYLAGVAVSDIGGLLVEQGLQAEALPAHTRRIVTSTGLMALSPQQPQMRRLLESDAKAFREQLTYMANKSAIGWSFERELGDPVDRFFRATAKWDWLVIGHRRIGTRRGSVVTIRSGEQEAQEISPLSDLLSRALHAQIVSLDSSLSAEEIFARVERTCAELVLIDAAHGPIRSPDQIRMLLEAARCPLLILGANWIRTTIAHSTQIPPASD